MQDTTEILAQRNNGVGSLETTDNTLAGAVTDLVDEVKAQTANQSSAATTGNTQSAPAKPLVLNPSAQPLVLKSASDPVVPTTTPLMMRSAADSPALQVPFVGPTTQPLMLKSAADGGGPQTYTVQRGDSLAKIAAKFGVTVDALCQANSIRNCNVIHKNQVLAIP